MKKEKANIYNILIVISLCTLIIARIIWEESANWINAINFAGIIMASLSLYFDCFYEFRNNDKINLFTGICICVLCVLVIIEVLILLNVVKLSIMANDIITLVTLLISLPTKLYKMILFKIFK